MHTVGADPEFLVEDVPTELVNDVSAMLNFFVERVRSGHPVGHGHASSSHGLLLATAQLQGAELLQTLALKCTACGPNFEVVLLEPIGGA